jgi:altronate dehydratase/Ser-tRNA(Ala) deacylase AlaX
MADIEIRQESPTAFYIKVHDTDNVAIIVNDYGLKAGTRFPDGLELIEHIPQGHKVALVDIPAKGEIVRYGEVIGYAVRAIPQGSWIDESLVELPKAPPLNTLPLATRVPEPLPPLEGYTFEGYRNADGSVGTKNLLGISTSVHCVAGVVDYVVKIIERDLLPKYPNVDGVVGLNHLYGCGVAINAPAAIVPIRTIHNIALNPNFGGEVMVVGLGCEKLQPEKLLMGTEDVQAIPVDEASIVRLQDEQHLGFRSMVDDILQVAERHLAKLNKRQRETCPASELVVGTQCGGSDAFSGVTANPAVGYASDLFVRCGATVMFSEVTEVRDAIHLLTPRAANEEVGKRLLEEMAWYDNYLDEAGFEAAMEEQRRRARESSGFGADYNAMIRVDGASEFQGYDHLELNGKVTALFVDGKAVDSISAGQEAVIVLDKTAFYAESGGQVGDKGELKGNGFSFTVNDTQKYGQAIGHVGVLASGSLKVGEGVQAVVDEARRARIRLNHSATHLMHAALRDVLGTHVAQKGSLVNDKVLRFDFSHFEAMKPSEIRAVEDLVNAQIRRNLPIETNIMDLEAAKKKGAMALFGEKYDERVRVLSMGDICGPRRDICQRNNSRIERIVIPMTAKTTSTVSVVPVVLAPAATPSALPVKSTP